MIAQSKVRALAGAIVILIAFDGFALLTLGGSESDRARPASMTTTTPVLRPGTPDSPTDEAAPAPTQPVGGTPTSSPSMNAPGEPAPRQAAGELDTFGTYAALKAEDTYPMDPRPDGYEMVIEGKREDAANWQLYARPNDSGDVCVSSFAWDNRTGRGGGGGHAHPDCPASSGWGWTMSDDDRGYVAVQGFAPGTADEIVLVAVDGREAVLPGVNRSDMGVSFFLAWLKCEGPDLSRLEARDAGGKSVSSYSFEDLGFGIPSTHCELTKQNS